MNCRDGYRTALRQTERDREIDKDRVLDRDRKTEVYEQRDRQRQYLSISVCLLWTAEKVTEPLSDREKEINTDKSWKERQKETDRDSTLV